MQDILRLILLQVAICQSIEIVQANSMVRVCSEHLLAIFALVCQTLHSNAFPRFKDIAIEITLIELAARAAANKLLSVTMPRASRETVFLRIAEF